MIFFFFFLLSLKSVFCLRFWTSGSCPYAQRTWIALEESGVDYTLSIVDLGNKSAEFEETYARANPGGRAKVPVLEVGEVVLTESLPVTEFVAEKYGSSGFYPSSPERRALGKLLVEVQPFSYLDILKQRKDPDGLAEALKAFERKIHNFDRFLERHGKGGPFLEGETFTFCDACVAPFAQRCDVVLRHFVDLDIKKVCQEAPRVEAYFDALLKRESVLKTGVPPEKIIESTENILKRIDEMSAKK